MLTPAGVGKQVGRQAGSTTGQVPPLGVPPGTVTNLVAVIYGLIFNYM